MSLKSETTNPKEGEVYRPGGDGDLRYVKKVFIDATGQTCVIYGVEKVITLKQWNSWLARSGAYCW